MLIRDILESEISTWKEMLLVTASALGWDIEFHRYGLRDEHKKLSDLPIPWRKELFKYTLAERYAGGDLFIWHGFHNLGFFREIFDDADVEDECIAWLYLGKLKLKIGDLMRLKMGEPLAIRKGERGMDRFEVNVMIGKMRWCQTWMTMSNKGVILGDFK